MSNETMSIVGSFLLIISLLFIGFVEGNIFLLSAGFSSLIGEILYINGVSFIVSLILGSIAGVLMFLFLAALKER